MRGHFSQWIYPKKSDQEQNDFIQQMQSAGMTYSPAFLRLCWQRGLRSQAAIEAACDQQPSLFHDPFDMEDMALAVERITQAVEKEESILIYGDYDADGITSTLIMKEALESIGAKVTYYLPNRFTDGYGPNLERYQAFIQAGTQLIITVDNGVAGFEALAYAKDQGVDVILTDHHQIQTDLPPAYAVIHPANPRGNYPFKDLSGAGVALKLATALLGEIPIEALELAAIGTVCDRVALIDENRTIVLAGINQLKQTNRSGLLTLFNNQNISLEDIDEETIGFVIGPRLNAVGRLGDPSPGLEFLASLDLIEANRLLQVIEAKNDERVDLVKQIEAELLRIYPKNVEPPAIIIAGQANWHPGVLGIVAGRLVERHHCPCLLFNFDESKGVYKGSGRSIPSINLFNLIQPFQDLCVHFGGHDQAVGLTIAQDQFDLFKQKLEEAIRSLDRSLAEEPAISVDLLLTDDEVTLDLYQEIKQLAPFGQENPKPLIVLEELLIKNKRLMGKDQQHVRWQFHLDAPMAELTAVAFSMAESTTLIKAESRLSILGELSLNRWRDQTSLQFIVRDFAFIKGQLIDQRSSNGLKGELDYPQALYLVNQSKLIDQLQSYLPESSQLSLYSDKDLNINDYQRLVILEVPDDLSHLRQVLDYKKWSQIILVSYVAESKYLVGLPTHQEFSRLYQALLVNPQLKIADLAQFAQFLKIPLVKIKTMIVVFFQAKFVKIEKGIIYKQDAHLDQRVDLQACDAMINYKKSMEAEAFLNFQSIDAIYQWMNKEL